MASDYIWQLPSLTDSSWGASGNYDWTNSSSYNLLSSGDSTPSAYGNIDSWYVDSSGFDSSSGSDSSSSGIKDILGGVWDWANSDMGVAVLGSAAGGIADLWAAQKKADLYNEMHDDGPSAAELFDARAAKHNESINQPMDMGVRKFKQ